MKSILWGLGSTAALVSLLSPWPAQAATINVPAGGSIQAAVTAAEAGDTIVVAAGTFEERVRIRKSLTLLGAQAGVDARTRTGAAESVILFDSTSTSSPRAGFSVEANDVIIDGFSFQFSGAAGTYPGRAIVLNDSTTVPGPRVNVTVRNNVTEGNVDSFLAEDGAQNILIERNAFQNDSSAAIQFEDTASFNVIIRDNLITGAPVELSLVTGAQILGNTSLWSSASGIRLRGANNGVLIQGNTIDQATTYGIRLEIRAGSGLGPNTNVEIIGNTVIGSGITGLHIAEGALGDTLEVHGNRFYGNAVYGLNNVSSGLVDAENNWWGCNGGPGATGCQTVNAVVPGTVDADPWLVLSISANPSTVSPGGSSTITVDMSRNSAGASAAPLGILPAGSSVGISTTSGTLNPSKAIDLSQGVGLSTLTAGAGDATVSAQLDGQTVSTTVSVVGVSVPLDIVGAKASPAVITPLNGKMRNVPVSYEAVGGTAPYTCTLSVSPGTPGDVLAADDVEIRDAHHVRVKARAATTGADRIYRITITCTDANGEMATETVSVTVPAEKKNSKR